MRPKRGGGLAVAAALLTMVSSASADNACNDVSKDTSTLKNGELYAKASGGWVLFDSLPALNLRSATIVHFAYVIRPSDGSNRTGVLIIKSNRPANAADKDSSTKRVLLIRRGVTGDPECKDTEQPKPFPDNGAYVSTDAYVDYHDYPAPDTPALRASTDPTYGRPDGKTLQDFHFAYHSYWKNACIRTDATGYDGILSSWNSNRAQFSFDGTVVARGSYTEVGLFWSAPSPFAGQADNRTDVKKYATSGSLACVKFAIPIDSTNYTIRVNDLEGRVLPPSNSPLREQRWPKAP
jgi:hypothetical protein